MANMREWAGIRALEIGKKLIDIPEQSLLETFLLQQDVNHLSIVPYVSLAIDAV
jgi:hypothetical protein